MPKPLTLHDCDEIFAAIRASTDAKELRQHFSILLDDYQVMSFEMGRGSVFYRGRIIDSKPFAEAKQLGYPPPQLTPTGRLNEQGAPILYASSREETVLYEIDAPIGSLVQIIGFRVLVDHSLRLGVIGELYHVYKTGYLRTFGTDPQNAINRWLNSAGPECGKRLIYIDAFLASLLADPTAAAKDYLPTRILTEVALQKSGADGFFYPSVQADLGMNLAILPSRYDASTNVVRAHVVRLTRKLDFGMLEYERITEATDLGSDGRFRWEAPEAPHLGRMFGLTKEEHAFLSWHKSDPNAMLAMMSLYQKRV